MVTCAVSWQTPDVCQMAHQQCNFPQPTVPNCATLLKTWEMTHFLMTAIKEESFLFSATFKQQREKRASKPKKGKTERTANWRKEEYIENSLCTSLFWEFLVFNRGLAEGQPYYSGIYVLQNLSNSKMMISRIAVASFVVLLAFLAISEGKTVFAIIIKNMHQWDMSSLHTLCIHFFLSLLCTIRCPLSLAAMEG